MMPGPLQKRSLTQAAETYHRAAKVSEQARTYLDSRGLAKGRVWDYQIGYVTEPAVGHEAYRDHLVIPYLTESGVVDLRFRRVDDSKPKYQSLPGSSPRLFNARTILTATQAVVVCEGELDAIAVEVLAGVPAVAYAGTSGWREWFPRVLASVEEVVVVADGDEPGRKAAKAVAKSMDNARVVNLPDEHDSNSYLLKHGADDFLRLIGVANASGG